MGMYGDEAKNIYEELKNAGIVGAVGGIKFELLNAEVTINDKSAIGYLLQEWLGAWLTERGIYNRLLDNSQEFPDFLLTEANDRALLELKSFSYESSPAFDVANFNSYVNSLRSKAYRLDADYLIFGYTMREGILVINDVWIKKIWELTKSSDRYPLNCQVKYNEIVNIRPYNIKSNPQTRNKAFSTRDAFLEAIYGTLVMYRSKQYATDWLKEVQNSYRDFTKTQL